MFPEQTPERSLLLPEELRFAREHGVNYIGNDQGDDPSGEAFVARTLTLAQDPSAWPILVHCHASMDRSPAWMGLYRFVVQGWPLADALREIERHRGLRPKASVTLLVQSRPASPRPRARGPRSRPSASSASAPPAQAIRWRKRSPARLPSNTANSALAQWHRARVVNALIFGKTDPGPIRHQWSQIGFVR